MRRIVSLSREEHGENLKTEILGKIHGKIVLIECFNYISQYMFLKKDFLKIQDNLFISRIEQIHDLKDILSQIMFNDYFLQSSTLIVTPFHHLASKKDLDVVEDILKILERIGEKTRKEVVLMEVKETWDTQYRLSGKSFTQSLQT